MWRARDGDEEEADQLICDFGWLCAGWLWVIVFWVGVFKLLAFLLEGGK